MEMDLATRIANNPKYQELKAKRSSFGWILTAMMMIVYYGYIVLIAFNKEFLGQRMGEGVTTLGVPIGMGVILFTIAITVYYVHVANSKFDALTEQIMKDVTK